MKKWLFLGGAIVTEVTGSLSLKAGLEHPGWYALMAAGLVWSVRVPIARAARRAAARRRLRDLGSARVALTALFSALLFGEPLTPVMGAGLALIIGGVLCIELGRQRAEKTREAAVDGQARTPGQAR